MEENRNVQNARERSGEAVREIPRSLFDNNHISAGEVYQLPWSRQSYA